MARAQRARETVGGNELREAVSDKGLWHHGGGKPLEGCEQSMMGPSSGLTGPILVEAGRPVRRTESLQEAWWLGAGS